MERCKERFGSFFTIGILSLSMIVIGLSVRVKDVKAGTSDSVGQVVVEAAKSAIGCGFVSGQAGPKVFDSPGLVYYAYHTADEDWYEREKTKTAEDADSFLKQIYHREYETVDYLKEHEAFKEAIQAGDIIVFYKDSKAVSMAVYEGYDKYTGSSHSIIGIYGSGQMVEELGLTDAIKKQDVTGVAYYRVAKTGSFQLRKVDENGKPVKSQEYKITLPNGQSEVKTTNSNGEIAYEDVEYGTYKYQEVASQDAMIGETFVYKGDSIETHTIVIPTIKVTVKDWYVGQKNSIPVVTGNLGNGKETVEYKKKSASDQAYTSKVPTAVGEYVARVTVAAKDGYGVSRGVTNFCIKEIPISKGIVSKIKATTYTGYKKTPSITVKMNGKKLRKGTDYTVSYQNNTKVGTAKVTIRGKGNYKGTKTVTFKIKKRTKFAKGIYIVKTKALKGHTGAANNKAVNIYLKQGDKVTVVKVLPKKKKSSKYMWLKIKKNGKTSYVYSKYLKL